MNIVTGWIVDNHHLKGVKFIVVNLGHRRKLQRTITKNTCFGFQAYPQLPSSYGGFQYEWTTIFILFFNVREVLEQNCIFFSNIKFSRVSLWYLANKQKWYFHIFSCASAWSPSVHLQYFQIFRWYCVCDHCLSLDTTERSSAVFLAPFINVFIHTDKPSLLQKQQSQLSLLFLTCDAPVH